jgi:hypothetical protein
MSTSFLRPSILPKLSLCGQFRSAPAGAAAERGTRLDVVFRDAIAGGWKAAGKLDPLELDAVQWAVDTARALANGSPLESDEEALKIWTLGMPGTGDLLCEELLWSADLKSGQKRNYLEQQAAYALGYMERAFADEWTVYLLYCDLREVETLRFTRESAEATVRNAIAKGVSGEPPTVNEYCGWCSNRFNCAPRRESLGLVEIGEEALLESLPSELLREFVTRAGIVEEFADEARGILKSRLIQGEKVAGVTLTSKRGSRKVPERIVELNLGGLGVADVLAAYGPMSEAKLREIWQRKLPGNPFPEDAVMESPGSAYITIRKPKAGK